MAKRDLKKAQQIFTGLSQEQQQDFLKTKDLPEKFARMFKAKAKKNTRPNITGVIREGETKISPTAAIDVRKKPRQLAGADTATTFTNRKEPTVATPDRPVISRAPTKTIGIGDFSDIQQMEPNQLQDLIDATNIRSRFGTITEQDAIRAQKALRLLNEKQAEVDRMGPVEETESLISERQEELGKQQRGLQTASERLIRQREEQLESQAAQQRREAREAGRREQQAAQNVLSFSGFGRSTKAAEMQRDIQSKTNDVIDAVNRQRDLQLELFRQEQAGATSEALAPLRNEISELQQQATQFRIDAIEAADAANKKANLAFEDKVNNILEAAAAGVQQEPTEDELAQVDQFANAVIDNDGNIDTSVLKLLPEHLHGLVIAEASNRNGPKNFKIQKIGKNSYGYFKDGELVRIGGVAGRPGGGGISGQTTNEVSGNDLQLLKSIANLSDVKRGERIRSQGGLLRKVSGKLAGIDADFNFIKDSLTLQNFFDAKKKGGSFGAMSKDEWDILKRSATILNQDLSEDRYNNALNTIKATILSKHDPQAQTIIRSQVPSLFENKTTQGTTLEAPGADASDEDILNFLLAD